MFDSTKNMCQWTVISMNASDVSVNGSNGVFPCNYIEPAMTWKVRVGNIFSCVNISYR
jgi:hypothetical protein